MLIKYVKLHKAKNEKDAQYIQATQQQGNNNNDSNNQKMYTLGKRYFIKSIILKSDCKSPSKLSRVLPLEIQTNYNGFLPRVILFDIMAIRTL
jgi:hypothetical protein